nr:reverse transcriptase domain-containing protein [Tanacetum cinerariifolium]
MSDQRTMAQLLQAPTKGYEDAIVVPAITANNFELKYAWIWLEKDPTRSIFTWDDLVSKLINQFFPPSKTTNLRNEITNFQQRFDESFSKAWDRFKDLFRACPHHGFLKLHQLDTFYNALNSKDQDSLNSIAGGNFLDKMPRECLAIIESKSKARYSRNKPVVTKVNTNTSTSGISPDVAELKDMVKALLLGKKSQNQTPATVKAVEESCVTCGGAHSYRNCPATNGNVYHDNIQEFVSQAFAVNYNEGNTSYRPSMMSNQIRPPGFPPIPNNQNVVENEPEATKDTVHPTNNGSTEDVQPQVVQSKSIILTFEPVTSLIFEPIIAPIFKDMSFEISFADALILMPKFALTFKALIRNKEKLSEMDRTPQNEHCSAVLLKKLPKKLGDPCKFLIPCDFLRMPECLALADLGASINLMPLSVWKRLSLPDFSPTCMTLELADRSISRLVGVAEDVYVKVGTFHFSVDFVVVDFDADPRVPLILGRSFLKTRRALIDVFEGELTLRIGKEAITFNLDQTSRYSANYNDMMATRIDVIDMAYEEYSQEVLAFSDKLMFLALEDDPTSPEVDPSYLDFEGDILLLEEFLNDDPSLPFPNQGNYLPEVRKELKIYEAKSDKSSIDEPPEVELKDLPPHLEYVFLEGDDKLPVIIAKDLSMEEKTALHKRAIAWKLSDIKGIDPEFFTHKFLMEEKFEPAVQHQRRVNPKIHNVIKNEVLKLLDARLIYPISNSPWEKTTFTCPYRMFAYHRMPFGLCNAPGTFQRCMMAIFHDMIEKTIEMFMDDFLVFGNSFQSCLSYLERRLKRCEDTNLCLNREKSYFMVKEGIVIGHKISKQRIKVDKVKVDVITKLPYPTTVKGIRSFLGHVGFYRSLSNTQKKLTEAPILIAPDWDMPFELICDAINFAIGVVLGKRQDKHFKPIHYASKTMTEAESNYTTTEKEMLAVVYAFEKFRSYLIMNKSIMYTDHSALKYLFAKKDSKVRLLYWVLLLQEFTFKVIDTKESKNVIADLLSRLENPHQNVLGPKEINESFPLETINLVSTRGNSSTPWFADFANYHAGNFIIKGMSSQQKTYKTPIGCTPYKLVYGSLCHLPIELEHKAYWALKHANFYLQVAGDHIKVQLNELRDQAYEDSLIYK